MVKNNKKRYRSDTGSAYSNRSQNHDRQNRSNKQNSPFNKYRRFDNSNKPRKYGSHPSEPRYNTESRTESRHNSGYRKTFKKKASRPPSPVLGSEEHMRLKIKQTSALIMRQLLSPEENIITITNDLNKKNKPTEDSASVSKPPVKKPSKVPAMRKKKKPVSESAEKIHDKIMYHLSRLNDGKKRNLINSSKSGYDEAIQQIVKQKRIEISRALRNMCSETSNSKENTDFINSIIPDIGIKIEDLPQELLEELQSTFDFEVDTGEVEYIPTVTSAAAESTNAEVLLNSEVCFVEDSNQPETPGQIFPECQPDKSVVSNTFHVFPSSSVLVNQINDNLEREHEDSSVGTPELLKVSQSGVVAQPETVAEPEVVVQPEIIEPEVIPQSGMNESGVKKEVESETPLGGTTVADTEVTVPDLNQVPIKTETDIPSVAVTANEIAQSELNDSHIKNETEPEISSVAVSPMEVIQPDPNKDTENKHPQDSEANIEKEDSSDVEIIEDEYEESKMHTEIILSDDEDLLACDESSAAATKIDEPVSRNTVEYCSKSTQTEIEDAPTIDTLLEKTFPEPPRDLHEAVERMMVTDRLISELVKYRQSLFSKFSKPAQVSGNSRKTNSGEASEKRQGDEDENKAASGIATDKGRLNSVGVSKTSQETHKNKAAGGIETEKVELNERNSTVKRRIDKPVNFTKICAVNRMKRKSAGEKTTGKKRRREEVRDIIEEINPVESIATIDVIDDSEEAVDELSEKSVPESETSNRLGALSEQNMLEFQEVREKMLVTKVFEDKLLAATESGKIFFCSLEDGHYTHVLEVTKVPISSLLCTRGDEGKAYIHVGSFESSLRVYNFHSKCHLKSINLSDSIQCMDENWGYIFLGCMRGSIIRYSIKKGVIEYEDKFTNDNIFVIKATKEGVRRVLLIGSRNAPVVIRAAMTGLHLRTMEKMFSPTVYSLIIEKNLVYCGTTSHDIMVFNFYDGTFIRSLKATNSKGISCLKIAGKLLFASCHNGKIYVYNIESNKFIDSIEGPGGVILSMEVLENQVVVGTMSFRFASIPIPQEILKQKY